MLKKEILELIKDMEDEVSIDETILAQGFTKPISDMEGLKQLLASNGEIKGYYQSALDSGIGKGVKTYQDNFEKNELPKMLEEGIKAGIKSKSNEGKSELEIKYEEQQIQIQQMITDKNKAEMVAKYKDTLSEKKIPLNMIDFLLGSDEDSTSANITLFEEAMKNYIDSGVSAKLNTGSYVPPKQDSSVNTMTKEKFLELNFSEQNKFASENTEQYKEIIK